MKNENFYTLSSEQPRTAVHFFGLLKEEEKSLPVSIAYTLAIKRAKVLDGKAYRGAHLGGCVAIPGHLQQVQEKVSNLLRIAKTYEN